MIQHGIYQVVFWAASSCPALTGPFDRFAVASREPPNTDGRLDAPAAVGKIHRMVGNKSGNDRLALSRELHPYLSKDLPCEGKAVIGYVEVF